MLAWLVFRNYLLSRRSGALVRIIAWHCILGVGMGVAALIIVLSVMNGFNLTIRDRMLSVEPHLVIRTAALPSMDQLRQIEARVADLSRGGVDGVFRFESQDLILRTTEGVFGSAFARGQEPEGLYAFFRRVWSTQKHARAEPLASTFRLAKDEVILGVDLARTMNVIEGDEIILVPPEVLLLPQGEMPKFQKFRVKGLVTTHLTDVDLKLLLYNIDSFPQRMRSVSRESGVEVRLKDPYEAAKLKSKLQAENYDVQTWAERDLSLFFALSIESWAMTAFLSLAVLITSFSIVIIMVLLLNQKRQDIGMLMALGLSAQATRLLFLRVGILLSGIGVAGGVVLGSSVALLLDFFQLELLPDLYTDSTLPAKLTASIFFSVLLGCMTVILLVAWLPVWRAKLGQPAECLRYGR